MTDKSRHLLIVGLGNPGPEYTNTRHNVGFMVLDYIAADAAWKKKRNYMVAKIDDAILIKPLTYMNLSGTALRSAMTKYKISITDVIVIHDDIDLKLGDLRIKTGGGNAGHNGLKSISDNIGNDYRRIRIGVGRPENPKIDAADWVLGRFTTNEMTAIEKLFPVIGQELGLA